ncbi:hypothetical protein L2D08_19045 [Domibacillus sp. PGB-M46]|uniref:hypothetical protein n=1 Tax=Domibacillus sp. PGB-M46 TaxID=2910255 RepID=UPI001F59837C|nr:hypothetical protein [Domibacillus sp. PGB-M46]MCI2256442.1 hypothetical protein [Domibacillus sp. PGB-M46]
MKDIEFETIGKVELEKGWKELFSHQKEDDGERTASNNVLPSVSKYEVQNVTFFRET